MLDDKYIIENILYKRAELGDISRGKELVDNHKLSPSSNLDYIDRMKRSALYLSNLYAFGENKNVYISFYSVANSIANLLEICSNNLLVREGEIYSEIHSFCKIFFTKNYYNEDLIKRIDYFLKSKEIVWDNGSKYKFAQDLRKIMNSNNIENIKAGIKQSEKIGNENERKEEIFTSYEKLLLNIIYVEIKQTESKQKYSLLNFSDLQNRRKRHIKLMTKNSNNSNTSNFEIKYLEQYILFNEELHKLSVNKGINSIVNNNNGS